jgi:chemotaxis family two-component system sensor kinase Cph1
MQADLSADEIQLRHALLDNSEGETKRFLEHVVHDIRAARRAVGIASEVFLAKLSPRSEEDLQKTIQHMQAGLAQMDAILAGISNYSLSLRASSYSFALVPAEMALRLALSGLAKEVRESGAKIIYERLPRVMGDSDRLTNLFRNLIDNALKYRSADPPQIEIQAKQDCGYWLFSVQDNGIGIDPKYWEGIFTPFSRLHGAEIPGVGLGLAICRKILTAHRGTIRIESVVGGGTTFFFTIPAEDATGE